MDVRGENDGTAASVAAVPRGKESRLMKKGLRRFGVIALALILLINSCAGAFAATTSDEITQRETNNSEFAYYAATQGMVLLENNGALPIAKEGKVALFGAGARHTVKGGTGSGDVNQRAIVTVEQGFENAGYTVTERSVRITF